MNRSSTIKTAIAAGKIGRPVFGTLVMYSYRADPSYYQSDPWRGRWDTKAGACLSTSRRT